MFQSTGIIKFGPGIKAFVQIDEGIANFYYALIPKCFNVAKQYYPAHISFVRHETPPVMANWAMAKMAK